LDYAARRNLDRNHVVVVILPDSGSRYLSKLFDDEWMRENGFLESPWVDARASDINRTKSGKELVVAARDDLITDVISLLKKHDVSQVPVVDKDDSLLGVVSEVSILNHLLRSDRQQDPFETIESLVDAVVPVISPETPLESLMAIFADNNFALISRDSKLEGILTKIDLLDFLSSQV
jgi:cystathionine beta-synthase